MSSGVYAAYSGAAANLAQIEILANNVANVDTAGFRRDQARFDSVLGPLVDFARAPESLVDLSPGVQRLDGNPLHAAIDGPGFFAFEGPDGTPQYTRRGDFRLNAAGELVLPDGSRVLGSGGALVVPPGTTPELRSNGSLATREEGVIGTLRVVDFSNPAALGKAGASAVTATATAGPRDIDAPRLAPGFVEGSNVNLSGEMVALIIAQRSFEASMNALRVHDEMTEQLIQAQS
jgi:flagellar basal body rod protein FlgG